MSIESFGKGEYDSHESVLPLRKGLCLDHRSWLIETSRRNGPKEQQETVRQSIRHGHQERVQVNIARSCTSRLPLTTK